MTESQPFAGSIRFSLREQHLRLLPQKAIFWEEQKLLILADLHLGKAGHFRKAGIPVPAAVHHDDVDRLRQLIREHAPTRVAIIGDLFHSELNREWLAFEALVGSTSPIKYVLVRGNHDILPPQVYQMPDFEVVEQAWQVPPFCFTHQPAFSLPDVDQAWTAEADPCGDCYNLAGHVHPGVSFSATGRHRPATRSAGFHTKVPCFLFTPKGGLLPAFGKFTGFVCLKRSPERWIFGIAPSANQEPMVFKVP